MIGIAATAACIHFILMKMEKLACLIVARNLGDAVIQSAFLRKLVDSHYAENYIAWVRPQVAFLFNDIPNCKIICSQFPVGTTKDFGWKNALGFLKAAWKIRVLNPSVTMDLIGDFRERAFAWLISASKHKHIGWAENHPFNLIIRNPFGRGKPVFVVPENCDNIYSSYGLMLDFLSSGKEKSILSKIRPSLNEKLKIGMHPFASQRCRLWPEQDWLALAQDLIRDGHRLTVFGAGVERQALERIFAPVLSQVEVYTRSLSEFTSKVKELDLLIGLDSFGIHMGQRQGIRTILINAGSNPAVWTPPSTQLIARSGGCVHYPCNNVPKCEGTLGEFICIRSVRPDEVAEIVKVATD
ncbi:hypothetical protein CSQ92_18610 [Janthinobacterium sp. BJB446]|nr:hypothetical protein CSQ92_18610 [Janthinobacterium sp. BJB446]